MTVPLLNSTSSKRSRASYPADRMLLALTRLRSIRISRSDCARAKNKSRELSYSVWRKKQFVLRLLKKEADAPAASRKPYLRRQDKLNVMIEWEYFRIAECRFNVTRNFACGRGGVFVSLALC